MSLMSVFGAFIFASSVVNTIYIPPTEDGTWQEAQNYCVRHCNSSLISIHNETEMQQIQTYLEETSVDSIWIGLNDRRINGQYIWSDHTPWNYGNGTNTYPWVDGHIASSTSTTDCVWISSRNNYLWDDEECELPNRFACWSCVEPNYYISPNKLTWDNAELHCNHQCNSHLASIHHGVDQSVSEDLATDTTHVFSIEKESGTNSVWIGLHFDGRMWNYTDGTPFDYGTDITGSIELKLDVYNPWSVGELIVNGWNQKDRLRIQMSKDYPYGWMGNGIDFNVEQSRFMCNSCDGILNKYIAFNQMKTYADAARFCSNVHMNTALASIHTQTDYDEAIRLCRYTNDARDCWIGGSVVGECVAMNATKEYVREGRNCSELHNFVCDAPSETCSHEFLKVNWGVIDGNVEWNGCDMSLMNGEIVNMYKQWRNLNGLFAMDIRFRFSVVDPSIVGNGGVLLYYDEDTICNYYYVGVTHDLSIFMDVIRNGTQTRVREVMMTGIYNETSSYLLGLRWRDIDTLVVRLNDDALFTYPRAYDTASDMSGYIGLRAVNMRMHLLSLFVSGRPMDKYDNSVDIISDIPQCAVSTQMPTTTTTDGYTTQHPTYAATRTSDPSFNLTRLSSSTEWIITTNAEKKSIDRDAAPLSWIFEAIIVVMAGIICIMVVAMCACYRANKMKGNDAADGKHIHESQSSVSIATNDSFADENSGDEECGLIRNNHENEKKPAPNQNFTDAGLGMLQQSKSRGTIPIDAQDVSISSDSSGNESLYEKPIINNEALRCTKTSGDTPQESEGMMEQKMSEKEGMIVRSVDENETQIIITAEGQSLIPIGEFEIQNSKSIGVTPDETIE